MDTRQSPHYCLQCDDGTLLEHTRKDLSDCINGVDVHVPDVCGWHCPRCGECEFDPGEGKRYSAAVDQAVRQGQAQELRAIRMKLGLKQADAGKLFGGGASAFSEYEHGKTQPHKSTVLLLRLLGKHPELLSEITAA